MNVAGRWRYVYRAIDQFGQVVDAFVSPRRDLRAARRSFQRAIVTIQTYGCQLPVTPRGAGCVAFVDSSYRDDVPVDSRGFHDKGATSGPH